MKSTVLCFGLTVVALAGWGLRAGTVQAAGQNEAAKPEFYTTKVQPIFQANCYRCHGGMNHRGGLSIQTRAGMLKGGHEGPVLVPGDPAKSLLVRLIRHEGPANDPMPMPPKLSKLSDADIATVEQWVRAGAIMSEEAAKP
jgi:cytochrome c